MILLVGVVRRQVRPAMVIVVCEDRQHTPPLSAVRPMNTFLMLADRANK
ncbi:hypothetical protein [Streptomyces sp. NPDC002676]